MVWSKNFQDFTSDLGNRYTYLNVSTYKTEIIKFILTTRFGSKSDF